MNLFTEMWNHEKGRDSLYSLFAALLISVFRFNTTDPLLNTIGNASLILLALLFIASGVFSYKEYRLQKDND